MKKKKGTRYVPCSRNPTAPSPSTKCAAWPRNTAWSRPAQAADRALRASMSCSTDGAAAAVISGLIPGYNFDVRPLVASLAGRCLALESPWKILCLDDGSTAELRQLNRALQDIPGVRCEELPQNVGRSAIRNRLAEMASFLYLLFMDCDSAVVRPDYMAQYATHCRPDAVLCGGRVYASDPPVNAAFLLHWTVGKSREEWSAARRIWTIRWSISGWGLPECFCKNRSRRFKTCATCASRASSCPPAL